ncbi:outer membrane protein assembly factor BamB [Candidatus Spongiihabitans sp.]|uniref:outer membrane protein assembly factor BamB n=1 Tax=Candidatus Spongiihabitans sp. TaxID=3101308 RepID=UPI003C7B131F
MNKYLSLALVALAVVLALASGCKSKQEKESLWGVYQEPIKPEALPKDSGARELQIVWKKNIGGGASVGFALLKPVYYQGNIYVANRTGKVFSFDSQTGAAQWTRDLKTPIFSAIGVNDNFAVVTHDNGDVTALHANDGSVAWKTSLKHQISAVPVIGKERVLIRTADGLMIGMDMRTGDIVWRIKKTTPGLSVHGDSMPVITGDAVLAGLANGRLIANNVINGSDYWETEIARIRGQDELERLIDSDAAPIVQGATVYAATYQGSVVALQLQNAAVNWRTKISTRLPMAISQQHLFVTDELGAVIALNITDGSIVWEQPAFRGHGISRPVVLNDRVIVGDSSGRIHTLDSASGDRVESKKVVSGAIVGIITADAQVAVFSSAGNIAALTLLH